jgi:hypothetical protein
MLGRVRKNKRKKERKKEMVGENLAIEKLR